MALLNETGDLENLEDAVFQSKSTKIKNSRLVPIYSRIKGLVKHLKESEERSLLEDYEVSKAKLTGTLRGKALEEKLDKMEAIYEKLLAVVRAESSKPARLVEELLDKFLIFYNILGLWKEYTTVMKMSNTELYAEIEAAKEQGTYQKADFFREMDYTSPDEQMTSEEGEGEGLDIEKLKTLMKRDLQRAEREVESARKKKRAEKRGEEVEAKDKETGDDAGLLGGVLEGFGETDIGAEAEEEWNSMGEGASMYGAEGSSKVTKAKDFIMKTNIEKIFPRDVVAAALDFSRPKLDIDSVGTLRAQYEASQEFNEDQLNGTVFIETIKQKLLTMDKSTLGQKEQKSLGDLLFLLDRIGEVKIVEARLLGRLFDSL